MQKQITLTIEQARELLGKDSAIDQLIRANFTDDELNPKPKYPKRWEDLGRVDGYWISDSCLVRTSDTRSIGRNRNVFATEQQAHSFGIIYPQLTQLMKVYRGGWEPDWNDGKTTKYCITLVDGDLRVVSHNSYVHPLSFPTRDLAQQFLTDYRDLILEFYKGM